MKDELLIVRYEIVDINKLVPYANNARIHSPEQIKLIQASIREQGFGDPIVVDENYTICAGHGRCIAAKAEGYTKVPCVIAKFKSEAHKKAYILSNNKLVEMGKWDKEMAAVDLKEVMDAFGNVELTAFDMKEYTQFMNEGSDIEVVDDNFDLDSELKKPVFSKTGDIWHLGRHTVICGDTTFQDTYKMLLGDKKVNLVCTDPPYFVNLDSASGKIKNDDLNDQDGYKFLMSSFANFKEAMSNDASIYVFYATMKTRIFYDAFEDVGFKVGAGLIWKKPRPTFCMTDWKFNMEPIIYGWKKDGKHIWYGDAKQHTVFEFDMIKNSKEDGFGHPSSKPVPLIAYLIKQSTQTNGLVLDGFLGSASTLIACEQLGRICYGIELEPKFVDVAVKRYLEFKSGDDSDITLIRNGKELKYSDVKIDEAPKMNV